MPIRPIIIYYATVSFVPPSKDSIFYEQAGEAQVTQRKRKEGRTIAMVAQRLPWSQIGGTVVARDIIVLLVAQRRHRGGRRGAGALPGLRLSFEAKHIHYEVSIGRPLRIHSATTTMCPPPFCLI